MPAEFSEQELERLKSAAEMLRTAETRLPVLRTISWDRKLADDFFKMGEREPPKPEYAKIDPDPSLELVFQARAQIDGDSDAHRWLKRFADTTEETAILLSVAGTPMFHGHSRALYGGPTSPIADGKSTALDLALRLDQLLTDFEAPANRLESPATLSAQDLKTRLDEQLPEHFGDNAPRVDITHNVSAKAAAGRDYIKLREDAQFSDVDETQLLQHEALVHIATGMNGAAQPHFPVLGEAFPGNARTQEGLAVFAEFISGSLDPRRFKRLADRVIAINMSAEGADFLELYRFFREQNESDAPFEAFESARRVVRGGLVNGGGPFTKDSIYLQGLLEVHNYLRAAIRTGDAAYIRLLFVGKIDLEDLNAMKFLRDNGLLSEPKFLPPWAKDLRYLLSYLAYSTFLNEIDLKSVAKRYDALFTEYLS
ncbi:flavohemoglobin expression-modulating QEGLA motif protein [Hyphococcus flavus]|uniref:Flavohemoglobin expression-modulating QEGLA motif protein n=1 Tax=Hyphococcus flavus TaxID=1866326 RepID=A0AAF0CI12_9PROT|nr:flavohemoglobin expression-modulating QEGLA motif protein [Hyphococcus flavus]WDI32412.1 flavohemoglobin expression-modulating QEGLA motif protein [Hyphococcus flavus]